MKPTSLTLALMLAGMLTGSVAFAQKIDLPRHEVWLGLGGAASAEKDIFNVPDDLKSQPDLAVGFGYMYNIDPVFAVGVHVFGTTETTPKVTLYDEIGNAYVTEFDLNSYNLGVRGRVTAMRGVVSPYAFAGVNYAYGRIESDLTGGLRFSGTSFVVGPGVSVRLARMWQLSGEGVFSFGSAKWSETPFPGESASRDFTPGLSGGLVNVSFLFGFE